MPHESTVDPEEPMHFKSWGEDGSQWDSPDRRRSAIIQTIGITPRLQHSLSIQTHPDLPLHVTHDHDNDGDPDDDEEAPTFAALEDIDDRSRITYTPPKRKVDHSINSNGKTIQTPTPIEAK